MRLAHVVGDAGDWVAARDLYRQTATMRCESQQAHLAVEAQAGLRGWRQVEAALAEREEGAQAGIAGVQEPQGVYLACYRLLREPGDDRAPAGPSEAFTELQRRAGTLDEEARRLYLEAVPANRAIVKAWRGQRNPR